MSHYRLKEGVTVPTNIKQFNRGGSPISRRVRDSLGVRALAELLTNQRKEVPKDSWIGSYVDKWERIWFAYYLGNGKAMLRKARGKQRGNKTR